MSGFLPVLNVLARIMLGFSLLFLVPLGWAWALDQEHLRNIWLQGMGLTFGSGLLLLLLTRQYKQELRPRDGFLLVNLVWMVMPSTASAGPTRTLSQ